MLEETTPVLVGCGQVVQKEKDVEKARSPIGLMADAARLAAADTSLGDKLWAGIDTVTTVRFITDSPDAKGFPFGVYPNAPRTLANELGLNPARCCYGPTGGNTPQYLVNDAAEKIANGEMDAVLLAGSECFGSMMRALGQGKTLEWTDDPGGERIDIGSERIGVSETEKRHRLQFPVNAYPLFENALRGEAGQTVEEHQLAIGKLMAPFTKVASQHPCAWFPVERSAEEIATPSDINRYVGFPYTKYMNAIMQVDQGAAVIMMSVKKARALGVPESKWVFLHGCADLNDIWHMTERVNFHSSPAIRTMGQKAFAMSGWSIGEIDYIDLYSCFPSAVQIGRNELGIAEDDPRDLTVTGGLPYFGGAGNNYVMHSIATLMDKLRAKPGAKGLCTSNGWYVTKHGLGLYSTEPTKGHWQREKPSTYQADIDNQAHPVAIDKPGGSAKVETYTVVHGRDGPYLGIIIGRLTEGGGRFVAHAPNDPATLNGLMDKDSLNRPGTVVSGEDGINIFTPE